MSGRKRGRQQQQVVDDGNGASEDHDDTKHGDNGPVRMCSSVLAAPLSTDDMAIKVINY